MSDATPPILAIDPLEEIRCSEERYRTFILLSSEGIWRIELEEFVDTTLPVDEQVEIFWRAGYLAECNDAMARMYGFTSASEIMGARLSDLLVRSDSRNLDYLRAFVNSGYRLENADSQEIDKDGNRKVILNNLFGVVEAGMLRRAWGVQRDVTGQREIEAQLTEMNTTLGQLAAAERTARAEAEQASVAKDRFLAVLSHELRTPLTPVALVVGAMLDDPRLPPDLAEQIVMIQRNIDLETRLIDDLLDLSRVANGKLNLRESPVAVHGLIAHVLEICRPDILARSHQLTLNLQARNDVITADSARIEQVLWNLLKNAIKFTPDRGSIAIASRNEIVDEHEVLVIEVSDTGVGLTSDLLPRIFNAFEQGESSFQHRFGGLGLGLAISKAIMDLSRGQLWARSDGKDRGAVFTMRLTCNQTADTPADVPASGDAAREKRLRILVVEDHADTARVMRQLLSVNGHQVSVAKGMSEAVELVKTEPFDLLISDIGLPDGNGLELMRRARNLFPKIPGIAISGYGSEADVNESTAAGFASHLTKPIDFQMLLDAMDRIDFS